MLVLIWIQTISHSYSVHERFFYKDYFKEEKNVDGNQSMKDYLACKEFRLLQMKAAL